MLRVMFADDEPYMLEGLRLMIDWHKLGFEVCGEALDGEDALAMMASTRPHLVLTDVRMPVIDGLELIELAANLHPEVEFIILSGYADFEYAKRAMRHGVANYLMKPLNEGELVAAVEAVVNTIQARETHNQYESAALDRLRLETISKLMQGEIGQKWMDQANALLNLHESSSIRCILLEPDVQAQAQLNLKQVIEDMIKLPQATLFPFGIGIERQGFLLVSGPEAPVPSPAIIIELVAGVRNKWGSSLSFSVSGEHKGPHALKEAFREGLMAEMCKFPSGAEGIYIYQGEQSVETLPAFVGMTESILDAIGSGCSETVRAHVHQLFVALSRQSVSESWVRAYLGNIKLEILKAITQSSGEPVWAPNWIAPTVPMDISLLERKVMQEFLQAAEWISLKKGIGQDAVISAAEDYVKSHYSEKLQLQHVAEHFRLNPAYFGQRFKKQVGLTFNEYLHVVRIDEAKKLLRREELKISDVADRLGYSDSEQFVTKFKALTGLLPSSYKKG
ncbi:response regulator [Paenibacillus sp. HWE-109]|uniref:response regulator transcription factor n=1 Tax=Paenibacillus sp. HWE-109 TaxID=1306526 RepID=UPI001EDD9C32|nr:response regulator [Paenibacillus sp. HWE-109]UKS28192.1 response regulator [Paenibacillus sp. HWE-109]